MTNATETSDPRQFLEEKIAANRKATKATWVVGIIVLVLIGTYMAGLVYLIKGILEPMTAARMIGMNIEASLPSVLNETELSLQQQATPLANALSDEIMAAMPQMRKEAEEQIDLVYDQLLPLMREEVRSVVLSYVIEHEQELHDIYAAQKCEGFAEAFVDNVMADLTKALNRELSTATRGHDLEYVSATSLSTLEDINEQLTRLIKTETESMSRSERLQRRLIVSWVHVLDDLLQAKERGPYPPVM